MPPAQTPDPHRLYNVLDVPADATQGEIKHNYRHLAKHLHPDAGGDPEEFRELQMAYDVLSDPAKRAEYNRTGIAPGAEADNERAHAIEFLCSILEEVVTQLVGRSADPVQFDLVKLIRNNVTTRQEHNAVHRANLVRKCAPWKKLAGRFSTKTSFNAFEGLVRQKLEQGDALIKQSDEAMVQLKLCAEILEDFSFDAEKMQVRAGYPIYQHPLIDNTGV